MEEFIKAHRQRLLAAACILVLCLIALFFVKGSAPKPSVPTRVIVEESTAAGQESGEESTEESAESAEEILPQVITAEGYGLYLDGEFVAALENAEDIRTATEALTAVIAEVYGAPAGEHSLYNDINIVKGTYGEDAFTDVATLKTLLGDRGNSYVFTATDVYGNPLTAKLAVVTKSSSVAEEVIAHGQSVTETDALKVGESLVIAEGADGKRTNTYLDTYINGVCTESLLQSSSVVTAPVDAVIWQGTESGASLMAVDEKLMLPYDGRVSSWYGYRTVFGKADFHNGIDFIAHSGSCNGDTIYAAADGVVVFAGWHSGYGLKLVIDHGDGLSTIYAHCSSISVTVGDGVLKGQPVAQIGATGRVTGSHLHFGVAVDGVECNPKPYLDWSSYKGTNK